MTDMQEFIFDQPIRSDEMFKDGFALAHGVDDADSLIAQLNADERMQDLSFRQGIAAGRLVKNLNKVIDMAVGSEQ